MNIPCPNASFQRGAFDELTVGIDQSLFSGPAEEWRPLVGFDGYEISDLGRLRSWLTRSKNGRRRSIPFLVTLFPNRHGYLACTLSTGSAKRRVPSKIHLLVLRTFKGPCPPGMEGCHDPDHTRANCRADNLRWDTRRANMADMVRHGRSAKGERHASRTCPDRVPRGDRHGSRTKPHRVPRGERFSTTRLTAQAVLEIRTHRGWLKGQHLAEIYGISTSVVSAVQHGRTWGHVAPDLIDRAGRVCAHV